MKKMKQLFALLLILVMALSLAACGGSGDSKGDDGSKGGGKNTGATPAPEFVYTSDYKEVSGQNSVDYFSVRFATDKGFYGNYSELTGQRELEEGEELQWEGQLDVYETRLAFLSFDGTLTCLEEYKQPELAPEEGHEGEAYTQTMAALPGGGFVELVELREYWSDAPDGVEKYSEEWYDSYNYEENYYIRTLDENGVEKSIVKMDMDAVLQDTDYFYPYRVAVSADGTLLSGGDGGVYAFDIATGEYLYHIECGDWVDNLIAMPDGSVGACYYDYNGNGGEVFAIFDENKREFGESVPVNGDLYNAIGGSGKYALYYTNGTNFYGFNAETGEAEKLFNWINCDVNGDFLDSYAVLEDGTVVGLLNERDSDYEHATLSLVTISQKPYDQVPHKQVITLGTQYLQYDQRNQIINFNRKNDQYRIEVLDYSEYNTEDDYSAGLTKLKTEIMSGTIPDILDLNGLPAKQLAAKGLLTDLYEMLDADPELSREDFFPNVLAALESDGKLYATVSSFSIQTVIGASRVVGDTPGWTYQQLLDALATMPEGCEVFGVGTTRDTVLNTSLTLDMDRFVNWNTGEVHFDSQEFIDLLEFAAQFPSEFDWENYEWSDGDDSRQRIMQGKQMLLDCYLYSLDSLNYYQYIFGGDIDDMTFIGYPCSDGAGSMLSLQAGYAISKNCTDKDAAWQFVRQFLTEAYQDNVYQFPTNIHSYEKMKIKAMTPEYEKDFNGNYVLDENGERIEVSRGGMGWSEDDIVWFYATTQEQADKVEELIRNTTRVYDENDAIFEIVSEQAAAFFVGQKSAADVAKLVQSKANIYVNEQR